LKKLVLKKNTELAARRREYRIRYAEELNPAQYEAVMHTNGAALVVAGAGTGKTRTLVYRVARLIEDDIQPESILLLTFTRKSAGEMLRRAALLLDGRCERVSGGTFHSFAHQTLRRFAPLVGFERNFVILDQGDAEDTINLIRAQRGFDQLRKRFPMKQTLQAMLSASINRTRPLADIIENDYPQFAEQVDNITDVLQQYQMYKQRNNMMDYDDLLVHLFSLLKESHEARQAMHRQYHYLMVDEYQDTNKLQHAIVVMLAGERENVMAVGDDAQSIYSFRGADFENIMRFPESFKSCAIIPIEENYRSTQPILTFANEMMLKAASRYKKELYSRRKEGELPAIISAENERQQSLFVVQRVLELREEGMALKDMAVLFRSGYLSFDLEIELTRANIPFRKFGGLKFIETAHVKDMLAYLRILVNQRDAISWHRVLLLLKDVGPRTAANVVDGIIEGTISLFKDAELQQIPRGKEKVLELFKTLRDLEKDKRQLGEKIFSLAEYYRPIMQKKYDDFAKRWKDIEMFLMIAERYTSIIELLSDMALEPPTESVTDVEGATIEDEYLTLSTIHSAKGLEWNTVFILWALDGKFPSTRAFENNDVLEEELRLMYVAATRAKELLYICYPTNIFDRETGYVLSKPSRFLDGIGEEITDRFMLAPGDEDDEDLPE
jgi:DNA helicase-2/ATP-dependent DNA helicase PcrA